MGRSVSVCDLIRHLFAFLVEVESGTEWAESQAPFPSHPHHPMKTCLDVCTGDFDVTVLLLSGSFFRRCAHCEPRLSVTRLTLTDISIDQTD